MTTGTFFRPAGLAALAGIAALSGCEAVNQDFGRQAIEAAILIRDGQALTVTPLADVQPSGTATYSGVVAFSYEDAVQTGGVTNFDLLADVSLSTDFDTNELSGSLSNFNDQDGGLTGTLGLSNGAIAGNLLAADATGTLNDGSGDIGLDLDVSGLFRGPDGGTISGAMNGTATPDGAAPGPIFGVFSADID